MEQAEEDPAIDDYMGEAVSISIKTSVPDYKTMSDTLDRTISDLKCLGLGGTRRKRKKKRTKRS